MRAPRKPAHIWAAFLVGVSLVVIAMGWVTAKVIELDDTSQAAVADAQFEERVRLALWRLDSVAAPIIATEGAQPYFAYRAFFPAEGAYKDMFAEPVPGELLVPSPLLSADNAVVRLHFQIDADGEISSPQVPRREALRTAAREVLEQATLVKHEAQLGTLDGLLEGDRAAILASLPLRAGEGGHTAVRVANDRSAEVAARIRSDTHAEEQWKRQQALAKPRLNNVRRRRPAPKQTAANTIGNNEIVQQEQAALNTNEYQRRVISYGTLGSSQSAANVYRSGVASAKKLYDKIQLAPQQAQQQAAANPVLQQQAAPKPSAQAKPNTQAKPSAQVKPKPANQTKPAGQAKAPPSTQAKPSPSAARRQRRTRRRSARSRPPAPVVIDVPLEPAPAKEPPTAEAPPTPTEGPMTPLWRGDQLLLARRVALGKYEYIQGAWLDWPTVEERLLSSISDLLPQARLVGMKSSAADGALANDDIGATRRLASLPVRLEPGQPVAAGVGGLTPLRLSLLIAWGLLLAGALAVGGLLRGALTLSERRGAFVSAVTHELRTPLTTFRMYTEMLAGGMVSDQGKQQRYLETLHAEAERLGHLVENVLAFAQIERRPDAAQVDRLPLISLVERLTDRLTQRAEQAGLALTLRFDGALTAQDAVLADPGAVERVLFNLVDNACKYGAPVVTSTPEGDGDVDLESGDNTLLVTVQWADSATARIAVRDFGTGIESGEVATIFRPFHKSAKKAATSAPGVGLGLALCRRLAIAMGGNLRYEAPDDGAGACFVLTLPRA